MLPAILIAAVCGALIYALNRQQATHAVTLGQILEGAERDRRAHRDEIQTLLQRIQAPEVAVIQRAQEGPASTVLPLDDDESAEAQDALLAADVAIKEMVHRENEIHGLIVNGAAG